MRLLVSSPNMPQEEHISLLTVPTVPPCKSSSFNVSLFLFFPGDEPNPQSHWLILSWCRMAFSAAYQMSLSCSVVVVAIQRGWITLIKAISGLLNSSADVGCWHLRVIEKPGNRRLQTKVTDSDVTCADEWVLMQRCSALKKHHYSFIFAYSLSECSYACVWERKSGVYFYSTGSSGIGRL